MLASLRAVRQTPTISPHFLPYRTLKRVLNRALPAKLALSHNISRWSCQERLCLAFLVNREEVARALFHTPNFREELPLRDSCTGPATFESRYSGVFERALPNNSFRGIARGLFISRGYRTRASPTRDLRDGGHTTAREESPRYKTSEPRISSYDRCIQMFRDREITGPKEHERIQVALAEGYRSSPKAEKRRNVGKLSLWIVFLLAEMGCILLVVYIIGLENSKKHLISPEDVDVTFDDVLGVEEAKAALQSIVEFLKNPSKFSRLGGKPPKGALLVGPPGTGKTLLARAVAGEAGVPFFQVSGSEFDEMFVGQGARRVRDLFKSAKKRAPCVIFIDEIDSVGMQRSGSSGRPHANQTLNQILSEMDGFSSKEGVIVLGATNRPHALDSALLRSGRFDEKIEVPPPDMRGRKALLDYYISKIKVAKDVNSDYLARGTTNFTAAEIKAMVNQAALKAGVDGRDSVTQTYLENARDRLLMGTEHRSQIPDAEVNQRIAHYEGGHALVAYYSEEAMPIHKVTIIKRGASLGHTAFIPSKDHNFHTKSQILARMDTLLGGRAAEELVFGQMQVTNVCSSDLANATDLATRLVKDWGLSSNVGQRVFKKDSSVINEISDAMAELVDQEIRRVLHESMERAKQILRTHERELKLLVSALLEYETLDGKDVKQLLETGSLKR